MQPYFFPYIGYFQLMKAVDIFVVYDDVQYMKGGWINRNRILLDDKPVWLTLPIRRASLTLPINQRHYLLSEDGIESIKARLRRCYEKAPAFNSIYPLLCNLLDYPDSNVVAFNSNLLMAIARRLDTTCSFALSSSPRGQGSLRGQDRVIDICHQVGADRYINPIGGTSLYNEETFSKEGIQLHFLKSNALSGTETSPPEPLSIIHTLMIHGFDGTKSMLGDCEIRTG